MGAAPKPYNARENPALNKVQTRDDVLQHRADVLVPVGAFLLVVEAQRVEHLMLDSVVVNAA